MKIIKYPFDEAAGMLKVVAHPIRLCIVALLGGEKCMNVRQIQKALGLKQSITSQHLIQMEGKGILKREKNANEVFYSIKKREVIKLLSCIKCCCEK